jgi:hypothetical protein
MTDADSTNRTRSSLAHERVEAQTILRGYGI